MNIPLFERLHKEGLLTDPSLDRIKQRAGTRLFSVHWELKTILYLGILLLTGGLGILIYKNIDSIGHQVILATIGLICAGSFFYCERKKLPFATAKVPAPNSFFDYILLLGCLTLLTFITYLQVQYTAFGTSYGLASFIPMVILFFCAYYFDHLGILSMAITNLAAWMGIAITPLNILKANDFANAEIIFAGLLLGVALTVIAWATERRNIKAHFEFTYVNFGINILFISCLAGMIHFDKFYALWLLPLAGAVFYFYKRAITTGLFYFILLISLYGYIGISYVIVRFLILAAFDIGIVFLILMYFIGSATGIIVFLSRMNKKNESMIAYNQTSLDNLSINDEATDAFYQQLITTEEVNAIHKAYPANLYMPNSFIRFGLFLLTIIIVSMTYGFLLLLDISRSETGFGILTFVYSLFLYGALEFIIREKKHYQSGIDDALQWLTIVAFVGAANLAFESLSIRGNAVLIFIPAFYFLLRFGNALMGALAFLAFLTIVFYCVTPLGNMAKTIMPFLLMAISFCVYWLAKKSSNDNRFRYYKHCCTLIEILALIILYAAGNYFVVREVSNSMFDLQLKEGESVPFGWIFWIPTVLLPAVYIFRGLQKRNVILLRSGLILVAAVIFTIRYYYHVAPIEIAMSIGGTVMIVAAYFITKYLTPPKHGFTHAEPNDPGIVGALQVEALIVAQTFSQTPAAEADNRFDFGVAVAVARVQPEISSRSYS